METLGVTEELEPKVGKRVKLVMGLAGRLDTPAPAVGGVGAASRIPRRN